MEEAILKLEKISKSFNGLRLLEAVDLELKSGTINTLLGGNGTGKSTLFNMIGGFEKPDQGHIFFNGDRLNNCSEFTIAHKGIGRLWQDPQIFPNHSVMENMLVSDRSNADISFFAYFFKIKTINNKEDAGREKAGKILKRMNLFIKADQTAGTLSLGERKILSICMLLMNDIQLFLLDEAFSGVNSGTIAMISAELGRLCSEGKTVFMIEHKLKAAEAITSNFFCIEHSKIKMII